MIRRTWFRLLLLIGLLGLYASVQAHSLDIARFNFHEQENPREYLLVVDNLPENIRPSQPVDWPDDCQMLNRRESPSEVLPRVEFDLRCEADAQGRIETRWGQDGGMLMWHYRDGKVYSRMLNGNSRGIAVALPDWEDTELEPRSLAETVWVYLVLGTEHVLIGWDHLAFVLCLSMLAGGVSLLGLISAFTLGHSLSLALAYFGVINIPIGPVEAVIALSVIFMAREAFFEQRRYWGLEEAGSGGTISRRVRLCLTAGFGLIHGLGFASVLGNLGVSASEAVSALLFFNLGVEVGQVLFVAVVLVIAYGLRRLAMDRAVIRTVLALVGGMGVFWAMERIVSI